MKSIFGLFLLTICSNVLAGSSVEEARDTVTRFCSAILVASDVQELAPLRSAESLAQDKEAEDWSKNASPEAKALFRKASLRMMKEMAKSFPSKMVLSCQVEKCSAQARLDKDWLHTIEVVKVNGTFMIGRQHSQIGKIK